MLLHTYPLWKCMQCPFKLMQEANPIVGINLKIRLGEGKGGGIGLGSVAKNYNGSIVLILIY